MENPPALLPTENYEAIEAAVMETARGRWFLAEYARRNRQADTRAILDAIDELSRQVDSRPSSEGELDLLRRINALAGFAARSRAALTIEVQGRETPLLRVALSMLAEIERKLQVLGGQEADTETDFLSASDPAPQHAEAASLSAADDAAEDELFAESPPDLSAAAVPEPDTAPMPEPDAIELAEADVGSEADSDLFLAEDESATAATETVEDRQDEATPAAEAGSPDQDVEEAADFSAAEAQAEIDALAAIADETLAAEPDLDEEMAAEPEVEPAAAAALDEAPEPLGEPEQADAPDESFVSPPIAETLQDLKTGEPRWVFARKPAPVPRIAEIDALSFEEKSVYFA